jgi:hypothetical protein
MAMPGGKLPDRPMERPVVVISAVMMLKQRAIVRTFERAAATTAATACSAEQLGLRQGLAWFQLVHHAVLRCPGEGRYFVDVAKWQRLRQLRRRIGLAAIAALLVLLALFLMLRPG